MVNVEELLPLGNVFAYRPESFEAGAVSGDDEIKLLTMPGFLDVAVRIEKLIFLRQGILIPADDFLALSAQGEHEAELGTGTVTVGPHVADDANGARGPDGFEDADNNLRVAFHQRAAGRPQGSGVCSGTGAVLSSSSMICMTRLPRTIESSTTKRSVGV